jgi:hypothetical protein
MQKDLRRLRDLIGREGVGGGGRRTGAAESEWRVCVEQGWAAWTSAGWGEWMAPTRILSTTIQSSTRILTTMVCSFFFFWRSDDGDHGMIVCHLSSPLARQLESLPCISAIGPFHTRTQYCVIVYYCVASTAIPGLEEDSGHGHSHGHSHGGAPCTGHGAQKIEEAD